MVRDSEEGVTFGAAAAFQCLSEVVGVWWLYLCVIL